MLLFRALYKSFPYFFADENSKDPEFPDPTLEEDDRPIEPYSDIGIDQINELMFEDWK